MRDELYIDGVKAELSESGITLLYKSNLLYDISKISSNNSYTIKLPKTTANMALIGGIVYPSSDTSFARIGHSATVIRDGVIIIEDAYAYLLNVGENIEIALTWGNITALSNILETDLTINQLPDDSYILWTRANSNNVPTANYGFRIDDPDAWFPPVLSAQYIFDKIVSHFGLKVRLTDEFYDAMMGWSIPALTMNSPDVEKQKTRIVGEPAILQRYTDDFGTGTYSYTEMKNTKIYGEHIVWASENISFYVLVKDMKCYLTAEIEVQHKTQDTNPNNYYLMIAKYTSSHQIGHTVLSLPCSSVDLITENTYSFKFECTDLEASDVFEIKEKTGDSYMVVFKGFEWNDIPPSINGSIDIQFKPERLYPKEPYERYYLMANMPEIKIVDFVKAMCYMGGVFPLLQGDTVVFLSISDLIDNIASAADWSGRILDTSAISFEYGDFAQKNWFRFKENDLAKVSYDVSLDINNKTLEKERDVVTLPFLTPQEKKGVPYIPLYSYNDDDELEFNNISDAYIFRQYLYGLRLLKWSDLIGSYDAMKKVIDTATVVEATVRLSPVELKAVRMDIPVYISKYGCYFGIIEIKTKENDVCEVKLLKL